MVFYEILIFGYLIFMFKFIDGCIYFLFVFFKYWFIDYSLKEFVYVFCCGMYVIIVGF